MNLHFDRQFTEKSSFLSEEESHHLISVLRKQTGERILLTNGKGWIYECLIKSLNKKGCAVSVEKYYFYPPAQHQITLFISVLKTSERMEWLVEKATEIGVSSIVFFTSDRTERKNINLNKLQNIAIAAVKQSGRCWMPEIIGPLPYREILKTGINEKWICTLTESGQKNLKTVAGTTGKVCVLIGPEGDFTPAEEQLAFDKGFKPVTLGKFTLRAETAGLVAVQTLVQNGST